MVAGEMRSVSYVQRVALDFSGSLFPHAICLGDADNDTVPRGVGAWSLRGRGWCTGRMRGRVGRAREQLREPVGGVGGVWLGICIRGSARGGRVVRPLVPPFAGHPPCAALLGAASPGALLALPSPGTAPGCLVLTSPGTLSALPSPWHLLTVRADTLLE